MFDELLHNVAVASAGPRRLCRLFALQPVCKKNSNLRRSQFFAGGSRLENIIQYVTSLRLRQDVSVGELCRFFVLNRNARRLCAVSLFGGAQVLPASCPVGGIPVFRVRQPVDGGHNVRFQLRNSRLQYRVITFVLTSADVNDVSACRFAGIFAIFHWWKLYEGSIPFTRSNLNSTQ